MEKKPNITPTPWAINIGQMFQSFTSKTWSVIIDVLNTRKLDIGNVVCTVKGETKEECEQTAQAIVTAVNCTYGANINPEKISGSVEVLQDLEHHIRNGYEIPLWLKQKLNEALNNIKYKD